jgi:hypothetical protein
LQIGKQFLVLKKKKGGNVPSNLFKGDVIETTQHFSLHLLKHPRVASNTEAKLCRAPILLNEV